MSVADVSIVIPVYNEEGILREAVTELLDGLDIVRTALGEPDLRFEVILAENGSKDRTSSSRSTSPPSAPRSGRSRSASPTTARRSAAASSRRPGTGSICEEIDLCDLDFHRRALELLRHGDCDMVVGSKAMKGASDERPLFRRAATRVINGMLRVALDFRGTDTHGLKAFDRRPCCRSSRRA